MYFKSIFSFIVILAWATHLHATDSTLYKLQTRGFSVIRNTVPVYYSEGHEARAIELDALFAAAQKYFNSTLGVKENYAVAVLSKEDWQSLTPLPYQAYHASDSPFVIFIPAIFTEEPKYVNQEYQQATTAKLKSLGCTMPEAEKTGADFRSIHEAGHLIAEQMLISYFPGKPNKWYNEFIASYIAYLYFAEQVADKATVLQHLVDNQLHNTYVPTYKTLADFEQRYTRVGGDNYGWYQQKFLQLVFAIYPSAKASLLTAIKNASFSKNEVMPVADLIQHLETLYPGFAAWSKGMMP